MPRYRIVLRQDPACEQEPVVLVAEPESAEWARVEGLGEGLPRRLLREMAETIEEIRDDP